MAIHFLHTTYTPGSILLSTPLQYSCWKSENNIFAQSKTYLVDHNARSISVDARYTIAFKSKGNGWPSIQGIFVQLADC